MYDPEVMMSFEERFLYCDPLLFKYMVVLMKVDSGSYTFLVR